MHPGDLGAKDYRIRDTHSRFVSMTIDMADISVERRVNPYDKSSYTFQELRAFYKGRYADDQIQDLWDNRMVPVQPKLLEQANLELRADRDYVLKAVALRGLELRHAAEALRRDKQVVLTAVKQDWVSLDYVPEELLKDRDVIMTGLEQDWEAITYAPSDLLEDEEVAIAALKASIMALKSIPQEMWQQPAVRMALLESLAKNPEPLRYCPKALHEDREVMLEALRLRPKFLEFLSPQLMGDRDFVVEAVKSNWEILEFLPKHFTSDREVIMAAVSQSNSALRLASEELRGDRELVLGCVQKGFGALRYASPKLLADHEIIPAAVRQDVHCLRQADKSLQDDKELMLKAVRDTGSALQYASQRLQNDPEVVLAAVSQSGNALEFASTSLRAERMVVLTAVRENKGAMAYASKDLRSDIVKKLNEAPLELLKVSASQAPAALEESLLAVGFTTIFEYLFLLRECSEAIAAVGTAGTILLAAAVSDFYVPEVEMATEKIQSRAHDGLTVQLRNVPKLLGAVRLWAPQAFILSFKLETNPNILLAKAAGALKKYKVDAVCSNVLQTIRDWVTIIQVDKASTIEVSTEISGNEQEPVEVSGVCSQRVERKDAKSVDVPLIQSIIQMHSKKMDLGSGYA
eukprot:symbB.v1.2.019703.t1/scaffold1623.1/size109029/2